MMKNKSFFFLLLMIFSLSTIDAQQTAPLQVAVYPFDAIGVEETTAMAITNAVFRVLNQSTRIVVRDQQSTRQALEQIGLAQSGHCAEDKCRVEAGKILKAQKLIAGSIEKLEENFYTVSMRVVDVETARTEYQVAQDCPCSSLVQVRNFAAELARTTILVYLETGKKPEQPQQPPPPAVTPPSVSPTPSPPLGGTPPSTPSQGYGSIKITTNPAGATVFVDATPMGNTPTTLTNIPAGERQLSIVKDGYSTLNKVVTVYAGRTTEVTETLARLTGSIMIGSSPSGAQVYLNDKYVGTTPYKVQNIPIGKYSVKVVLQDYKEYRGEVSVEANEESKVEAKLEGLPGKVLITSTPAGAEVSIDGKKVGVTPYSGELSAGAHKVRVWKEGYQSAEESITIEPNRAKTMDFVLKKGPDVRGEMVYVPAGEFMMGCNEAIDKGCESNEKPYHKVYLNAYYIDKYEVTVSAYTECVKAGKCTPGNSGDFCNYGREDRQNHPINCVDWNQARTYCEWAGKRLPTEAEWEKAARGTDGRVYPWGNEWNPRNANWGDGGKVDGYAETAPVGSFAGGVSPYGAYDMSGNVWEWVADWYDEGYYKISPSSNPKGPASGSSRVVRSGGWDYLDPNYFRASYRFGGAPGGWLNTVGFRCSRD